MIHRLAFGAALLVALFGMGCASTRISASTDAWLDSERSINEALTHIGVYKPSLKTLGISASRDIPLAQEAIWGVWSQLDKWPSWSEDLFVSTRWMRKPGWVEGNEFEQVLDMGFPIGEVSMVDTISAVTPGRKVAWWRDEGNVKSCHIWEFVPLPGGGTRVIDTEVYHGWPIFWAKPFVGRRWQRLFDDSVSGLAHFALGQQSQAPVAGSGQYGR